MTTKKSSDEAPISELMVTILQQQAREREFTVNSLVGGYKNSAEKAQATLDAVRFQIKALYNGPYAPNPFAVLEALYPDDDLVQSFLPSTYKD